MCSRISSCFMKMVSPCWKSSVAGDDDPRKRRDKNGRTDGLFWYKDFGQHVNGEFSMALIQANNLLEDQCQLESGPLSSLDLGPQGTFVGVYDGHGGPETSRFVNEHLFQNLKSKSGPLSSLDLGPQGTFVGVYDGHGGPETSRFVNEHLFQNLKKFATEHRGMSSDVIQKAFLATEEEFLSLVKKQWHDKPQLASVGTCCLVGIVCNGTLYIANAGDSRAVLGRSEKATREVIASQLSTEHNACIESVREDMRTLHPDDPQIVVLKHKVWRVKGLIQITRSIGDAYLKRAEFNREPLLAKFRLPKTFHKPILRADPSILVHKLKPQDQFIIFASDGLWEHLSNQEAVDIVHQYPRNGIAKRLVKAALREAAKKREMRYSDLKKIDRGVRRHFHDDITVIVLFLDHHGIDKGPMISIKGAGGSAPTYPK